MKALLIGPRRDKQRGLCEPLARRGHEVIAVEDADAACACQAAENHPLVVLDADALGDGVARLCRRLRAASQGRECMILAVTARHEMDHLQSLLAAGADDCLTEPADDRQWELRLAVAESRLAAARLPRGCQLSTGERCCALVFDVPYGVFRSGVDGKILEANSTLVNILGYDSREELLALDLARDVYRNPGDREELLAAGGDYFNGVELDLKRKDGAPITVRLSGRTMRDEQGAVVHLEGIIQDVTEQKQAEEALRQTNEQLQAIYGGVAEGILVADVKTKEFLRVNPAMSQMLGYSEDELLSMGLADIHPAEALPEAIRQFEAMHRDRTHRVRQLPFLRKDGSTLLADVVASPIAYQGRGCLIGFFRDVTEHVRAVDALAKSEARFRALFEGAPLGIALTNSDGKVLEVNPELCRMFGYASEELVGRRIAEMTHPDDLSDELRDLEKLKEGLCETVQREKRYHHKDGSTVWCHLSASVIRTKGEPQFFIGVVKDITERKQAERAVRESEGRLRESESRYRLIADNVTDMIWTATPEGLDRMASQLEGGVAGEVAEGLVKRWQFSYISPSVRRFLGYDVDEALRLSLEELLTPSSYQLAVQVLAEELACEQQESSDPARQRVLELEHRTQGGSVRWAEVITTFLRDETQRVIGILGVTRDITDRKQAEEALRESESTLRNLIENMPDLVFVVDWDGILQYVNRDTPAGSRREMVGKNSFSFIQPQHHERCREAFAQARQNKEVRQFEVADVFDLWWSCRVVPVIEDGEPRKAMLICTDVTQRRRAQERVLQEQELLRQLLELHERDRELLAFELHDGFAQLLTGAMLNFEAAAQLQPTDPEKARASFQSGTRLLGESISESRRLVSGLRPPVLDQFGIVPAIEQLVIESQTAGKQQIDFVSRGRFQRLARPVESAIFRIVQETLTNARRHSQSQKVRLELSQDGSHVCVTVRDWGVGFDPDQVDENCFGIKGIRERARLLGGEATIQTGPGSGTCVTVKLPQVKRAQDRADRSGEATTLAPEQTGRCGEDAG